VDDPSRERSGGPGVRARSRLSRLILGLLARQSFFASCESLKDTAWPSEGRLNRCKTRTVDSELAIAFCVSSAEGRYKASLVERSELMSVKRLAQGAFSFIGLLVSK
jgi:hypothetical protein